MFALRYYEDGADELIYMDCVASLYGRNHLALLIQEAARNIFVPITVGGGIRSVEDARCILRAGADKVAVNTAAVKNPALIKQIAEHFGSQSMVISIEAKQIQSQKWEVFTDNGRGRTGRDVVDWAAEAVSLGAGEILLTSVDREGTRKGFDRDLIRAVTSIASVPVIASGGMGAPTDLLPAVQEGHADAVAMADILHYQRATMGEIRRVALDAGIQVRSYT